MSIFAKVKQALRRKPLTAEDLAAQAEAKVVREQMLQDRLSQESRGGETYRSGRR
jgi:hypothetical protein